MRQHIWNCCVSVHTPMCRDTIGLLEVWQEEYLPVSGKCFFRLSHAVRLCGLLVANGVLYHNKTDKDSDWAHWIELDYLLILFLPELGTSGKVGKGRALSLYKSYALQEQNVLQSIQLLQQIQLLVWWRWLQVLSNTVIITPWLEEFKVTYLRTQAICLDWEHWFSR